MTNFDGERNVLRLLEGKLYTYRYFFVFTYIFVKRECTMIFRVLKETWKFKEEENNEISDNLRNNFWYNHTISYLFFVIKKVI